MNTMTPQFRNSPNPFRQQSPSRPPGEQQYDEDLADPVTERNRTRAALGLIAFGGVLAVWTAGWVLYEMVETIPGWLVFSVGMVVTGLILMIVGVRMSELTTELKESKIGESAEGEATPSTLVDSTRDQPANRALRQGRTRTDHGSVTTQSKQDAERATDNSWKTQGVRTQPESSDERSNSEVADDAQDDSREIGEDDLQAYRVQRP